MREGFDSDAVQIGLGAAHYKRHDIEGIVANDSNGKLAHAFENFFRTRLIECGPIEADKAQLLLLKSEANQSVANVRLEKEQHLGYVSQCSREEERFAARQGKWCIELTSELEEGRG